MQSEYLQLEQLKLSSSTKSATGDKFITKKTQGSSAECWVHCGKIVNQKYPSSTTYILQKFPIFVVKLKFLLHFIYILLLTSHWC